MSKWTPEQRAAAAQKRAEAKAPLLARAGLVEAEKPSGTNADFATDFKRRMAESEARCHANILECRGAIAERAPERLAAFDEREARLRKYDLEIGMIANHWTNAYREVFGRLPPSMEHTQRTLDYVRETMVRERAGAGEQLDLLAEP